MGGQTKTKVHKGTNSKARTGGAARKRGAKKTAKPGAKPKEKKESRFQSTEGVKLKTRKRGHTVRREKKKEAQLIEGTKEAMILRGPSTSQTVTTLLRDMAALKNPHCKVMSKRNAIYPFEDESSLEFLSQKNDASLFCLGSSNKKRPDNIVLGRMFDHHLLDMVELGVDKLVPLAAFDRAKRPGSRPCFIFEGSVWEHDVTLGKLKNRLLDFFRGAPRDEVSLAGLECVCVCTTARDKVYLRHYMYNLRKIPGSKRARVELDPMGPSLDLSVRRTKFASKDLYAAACRQPKAVAKKKEKNISTNEMGERVGRVHMERQDMDKVALSKTIRLRTSGLRGKRKRGDDDDAGADDDDDE